MKRAALVEGNPESPVRVIVYESLQCKDCAAYREMMDEQLLPSFGSVAAFEHRDFPLGKHAWARAAAVAARFFDDFDSAVGIEFRRIVMAHQPSIDTDNFLEHLVDFAGMHDIQPANAVAALDDEALAKLVEDDNQEGIARGVSKTPTVYVNGEKFIERFTFEEIASAIQRQLSAVK